MRQVANRPACAHVTCNTHSGNISKHIKALHMRVCAMYMHCARHEQQHNVPSQRRLANVMQACRESASQYGTTGSVEASFQMRGEAMPNTDTVVGMYRAVGQNTGQYTCTCVSWHHLCTHADMQLDNLPSNFSRGNVEQQEARQRLSHEDKHCSA
jgi:hypothetical protein